ncbi:MAG TPA: APC family permease [Rhizomicrobium sp.]|nr:APC family permease [Rhizomicrobium sp.]
MTLSCLSPVFSIYGVGGDVLVHAGTGTFLLALLGLGAALLWGFVYAELGSAFPYAGGDYVGVGRTLGGWAGAATLALWLATMGPVIAFECQIAATYAEELVHGIAPALLTLFMLAAATLLAVLGVRTSAMVTGIFLSVEMIAVVTLIACGFWHPVRGAEILLAAPRALSGGVMAPVSLGILASALVNTAYGTVGGNQAIYFGEELRDPHRQIGRVIIAAALTGGFATALPLVAVTIGAHDLSAVLASPAPFATFVSQCLGPWAAQALSAGVVLAIFNAIIATIMVGARLLFSVARDELLPAAANRLLSSVGSTSGVPSSATLVIVAFSALCCLLASHLLLVFISGLIVYGWGLVCFAVLVGRRKGLTGGTGLWRAPLYPLAPLLGFLMAIEFAIANLADATAGRPSVVLLGLVMTAAIIWYHKVLKKRGWQPRTSDVAQANPLDHN